MGAGRLRRAVLLFFLLSPSPTASSCAIGFQLAGRPRTGLIWALFGRPNLFLNRPVQGLTWPRRLMNMLFLSVSFARAPSDFHKQITSGPRATEIHQMDRRRQVDQQRFAVAQGADSTWPWLQFSRSAGCPSKIEFPEAVRMAHVRSIDRFSGIEERWSGSGHRPRLSWGRSQLRRQLERLLSGCLSAQVAPDLC